MLLKQINVSLSQLVVLAVAGWVLVSEAVAQQDKVQHAPIQKAIQAGQIDQARRFVQAAKERDPKDFQLRFLEGVVMAQSGQNEAAIDVFEKLTKERPDLPEPWNNLGALYAAKGKLEEARTAFQRALGTDNSYRIAHRNLADMQVQMARSTYKKALQIEGVEKDANAKLALLGSVVLNQPPSQSPRHRLKMLVGARAAALHLAPKRAGPYRKSHLMPPKSLRHKLALTRTNAKSTAPCKPGPRLGVTKT
jgi:tetratricopeptide (TPR) repeat protein